MLDFVSGTSCFGSWLSDGAPAGASIWRSSRRHIAQAQTAIDTPIEPARRVFAALGALQVGIASILRAVRVGLDRSDVADNALRHVMLAARERGLAEQRGRFAGRRSAEDLRAALIELANASDLVAQLLQEVQPHTSSETREALDSTPMMLAVAREALAVRRPRMSTDDVLESVGLNVRLLIDTSDALRRGVEAALIRWSED